MGEMPPVRCSFNEFQVKTMLSVVEKIRDTTDDPNVLHKTRYLYDKIADHVWVDATGKQRISFFDREASDMIELFTDFISKNMIL